MTTKHTPGPWNVANDTPHTVKIISEKDPSVDFPYTIAQVWNVDHNPDADMVGWFGQTSEANARLIAAAPELLEACKAYKQMIDVEYDGVVDSDEADVYRMVSEAIAKAEVTHGRN